MTEEELMLLKRAPAPPRPEFTAGRVPEMQRQFSDDVPGNTTRAVMSLAGGPVAGAALKGIGALARQRAMASALRESAMRLEPVERMFTP